MQINTPVGSDDDKMFLALLNENPELAETTETYYSDQSVLGYRRHYEFSDPALLVFLLFQKSETIDWDQDESENEPHESWAMDIVGYDNNGELDYVDECWLTQNDSGEKAVYIAMWRPKDKTLELTLDELREWMKERSL